MPASERERRVITVEEYRKSIQRLGKQQDRLFRDACKALDIDPTVGPNSDVLFDHLYNNTTTADAQIVEMLWPAPAATKSSGTKSRATKAPGK